MRIVHIVRNIEYIGGTEKFLISLLMNWRQKFEEDEVIVLCTEGVGPIAKDLSRRYQIRLLDFPVKWWNSVDIFRLSKKLENLNPDIVHTHLFQTDFPGILASTVAHLKTVSTKYCQFSRALEKNNWVEKYFTKPLSDNILEFLLSFFTNKVIIVSKQATNHFLRRGYKKDSIVIIPCCHIRLKDELFNSRIKKIGKNNKIKIGTVSRLVPEKGIDDLLVIFSLLVNRYKHFELYIAGDGFLKKDLEKQAESLDIIKKVHFLGHINNVDEFLRKIDIFVFTSLSEGFPLAVQEAMAAGKPIVSTSAGGIKELIGDKKNGLLFRCGDNLKAVSCIKYLLENPAYATKLSVNARKSIKERYNLDLVINSIYKVYSDLLKS